MEPSPHYMPDKKDEEFSTVEKYSLSIYHFNLQYKAGDKNSYFALVEASFKPFLRFFEEFPGWKADLELQGHMIAFLARHFPEELELLRKLNNEGRIEIVNVHYSDQIYPAYPYLDMQISSRFNDLILNKYGLKRSGVFFAQENFFGKGAEKFMAEHGYDTALWNHHYYSHHHSDRPFAPYYTYGRIRVLVKGTHGYDAPDLSLRIRQQFHYWDDGELAFANGNNYMPGYGPSEKMYRKHILKYRRLEAEGYKIVTVSEYIKRVADELGLPAVPLGEITDGTWNMRYYGGVYLWMGTYRLPWERDGEIRSLTFRARNRLMSVGKLLEYFTLSGIKIPPDIKKDYNLAWRHMLLAEVSDSTGQTPVPVEIYYSISECADVFRYCELILEKIEKIAVKEGYDLYGNIYGKVIDTFAVSSATSEIFGFIPGFGKKIVKPEEYLDEDGLPNYLDPFNENAGKDLIVADLGYFIDKYRPILRDSDIDRRKIYAEVVRLLKGHIRLKRIRSFDYRLTRLVPEDSNIPIKTGCGGGSEPNPAKNEMYIFDVYWRPRRTPFINRVLLLMKKENSRILAPLFDYKIGSYAGLIFPMNTDKLIYTPAMMEETLECPKLDIFDFARTWLPLPNGVIGLGNDVFLIKYNYFGNGHIAVTYNSDGQFGKGRTLSLMTLNPPASRKFIWRFAIFRGSAKEASALADRINAYPKVPLFPPSKKIRSGNM